MPKICPDTAEEQFMLAALPLKLAHFSIYGGHGNLLVGAINDWLP